MGNAADNVKTHDVAFGIDPRGSAGCRSRRIDGHEGILVKQKAMVDAAGSIPSHDIALGVIA